MVIISRYKLKRKDGCYKVLSYEDLKCPLCGNLLKPIGTRKRKLLNPAGDRVIYIIRRLRCSSCGKIHHELPKEFIPYHLICVEILKNIESGCFNNIPLEQSAISRLITWWITFKNYTSCIDTIDMQSKINSGLIVNTHFMISESKDRSKIFL